MSDEPIAWEAEAGMGIKRFVSDRIYRLYSPKVQRFYKPYRCASCATVKEADVSAIRDAALEAAAQVVEAEFERVMAAQYPDAKFGSMHEAVNTNIRMTSVLLPEVAAAIRALRGRTA